MTLTDREREVLEELVKGTSSRDIAERLRTSEENIETHVTNIFRKLEVRSAWKPAFGPDPRLLAMCVVLEVVVLLLLIGKTL